MSEVSMRMMIDAGVHFGHQTRHWNPKMEPFLYGKRNRIHIINLEHTLPMYQEALNYIGSQVSRGGSILFVGTKRAAQSIIREQAIRCQMPYVNRRWLGGLLTNFKTVKTSVNRLRELEAMQKDGTMRGLSKKEGLSIMRELEKLDASLSGIKGMDKLPDVLFVIDVGYEQIAVKEALRLNIPVVAVVDSNNAPDNIDYVIPGNDDAICSINLYCEGVADAILDAQQRQGLQSDADADEFVELDANTGRIIVEDEAKAKAKAKDNTAKVTVRSKKARKITVPQAGDVPDEGSASASCEDAEHAAVPSGSERVAAESGADDIVAEVNEEATVDTTRQETGHAD